MRLACGGKQCRYSSVRVIASRILHEICLLIGELAIRGTKLTLNARLGTKSNLLIEQLLLGEHHCMYHQDFIQRRVNLTWMHYCLGAHRFQTLPKM